MDRGSSSSGAPEVCRWPGNTEHTEPPAGGRKNGLVSPDGRVLPCAAVAVLPRSLLA